MRTYPHIPGWSWVGKLGRRDSIDLRLSLAAAPHIPIVPPKVHFATFKTSFRPRARPAERCDSNICSSWLFTWIPGPYRSFDELKRAGLCRNHHGLAKNNEGGLVSWHGRGRPRPRSFALLRTTLWGGRAFLSWSLRPCEGLKIGDCCSNCRADSHMLCDLLVTTV